MVLPLLAGVGGALAGSVAGGLLTGKKEYATTYEAPYHTYAPVQTYAPQTSIAYTSGARILNSPYARTSESVGLTPSNTPYINSMPNTDLSGLNPSRFIPILLVIGGVGVVLNLTKKK